MNFLEFVAAVLDAIAWPVAIAGAVVLLRSEIRTVIPRMRRFRFKDFEADFGDELKRVEEEVSEQIAGRAANTSGEVGRSVNDSARISPQFAVLEGWFKIEKEVLDLAKNQGIDFKKNRFMNSLLALVSERYFDRDLYNLLVQLRHLRNLAAHPAEEREITEEEAREFAAMADLALQLIRDARRT